MRSDNLNPLMSNTEPFVTVDVKLGPKHRLERSSKRGTSCCFEMFENLVGQDSENITGFHPELCFWFSSCRSCNRQLGYFMPGGIDLHPVRCERKFMSFSQFGLIHKCQKLSSQLVRIGWVVCLRLIHMYRHMLMHTQHTHAAHAPPAPSIRSEMVDIKMTSIRPTTDRSSVHVLLCTRYFKNLGTFSFHIADVYST